MTRACSNTGVTLLLVYLGRSLMLVHCFRSWRLPGHHRHSLRPSSSLKGFTLELLKVLYVCTRPAAVRSSWTAVAGSSLFTGIGGSNTLGFFFRSVTRCLLVPRRSRKIYWGYVVQPANDTLVECEWVRASTVSVSQCGLAQCYITSIVDNTKCHVTFTAMLLWLLTIITQGCFIDKW